MKPSRPWTDSSLNVPPHFWRDSGRSQKEWLDEVEKFRLLRGNVVAEAYDLENTLGRVLAEIFYPTIPWHPSHDPDVYGSHNRLRVIFVATFLDGAGLGRRLEMLRLARSDLVEIRDACPNSLMDGLNRIRVVRNQFAHDPVEFYFTPPPEPQIRAHLVGHVTTELTSEYILSIWQLFVECSAALTDCLLKLQARFDKFAGK